MGQEFVRFATSTRLPPHFGRRWDKGTSTVTERTGASQNFAGKVLVQRNGILDSISFTVARATIPTNYWASG